MSGCTGRAGWRTCRMERRTGIRVRGPTADPREERRAILGVPHLDRLAAPHGGVSSGLETLAGLLQQPGRGLCPLSSDDVRWQLPRFMEPTPRFDAWQRALLDVIEE